MREKIIRESLESIRREGLRFSVDTLAEKLRVSKKTIYRYFPDKEALATAMYQSYYAEILAQARQLAANTPPDFPALLRLYLDSKNMSRSGIFNKYKLNDVIYAYVSAQNDALWNTISAPFGCEAGEQGEALRLIVDGSFEKLCGSQVDPEAVIERLVKLL